MADPDILKGRDTNQIHFPDDLKGSSQKKRKQTNKQTNPKVLRCQGTKKLSK